MMEVAALLSIYSLPNLRATPFPKHKTTQDEFRVLRKAWSTLSDPAARYQYDAKLRDLEIVANTATSNHLEIDIDDME